MLALMGPAKFILLVLSIGFFTIPVKAFAFCGDGVVEIGEECDDDNVFAGDGCSPACTEEAGFTCYHPTPFDVQGWTQEDYLDPSIWTPAVDFGDVSFDSEELGVYLSNIDPTAYGLMSFSISVEQNGDDDFIGFVVGMEPGDAADSDAD